jgi:hypothetical protein
LSLFCDKSCIKEIICDSHDRFALNPCCKVLGPILFLIYINDLPEYIKHSCIRLFADDSMIYRQIKSQSDCLKLQEDLEAAIKWEQDWIMSFHPDKCNIMNITTKRNPIHFYYNMHGHILESVQHAKYLGMHIIFFIYIFLFRGKKRCGGAVH